MIRFLQTPGPLKKIVLGAILVLVIVSMVIFLIPGIYSGVTSTLQAGVLAQVGSEEVTSAEVQREARNLGRQMFQRGFPESFLPFLVQRAADSLILRKALSVEAARLGLRVTNDELRDELRNGPFAPDLFPGGNFVGQERYQDFTQNFNLSVEQFEDLVKQDMLIRKLRALVEGGVAVADSEVQQEYRRENLKVKFDYAVLTPEEMTRQVGVTDAELKAYFEKNKDRYKDAIPEKRRARYVVIDTSKLEGETQVSRDELQRLYEQRREQMRVPEQVNVRHILIKTPAAGADGKVDARAVEAARVKAEGILQQLRAGAKFEELAKKYSEDPGSAPDGGSLGWIGRGRTVPEFEQAAFSLSPGQISELVKTTYGFHILRVDGKQAARVKPLEEVKDELEPQVAQQKAAKETESLANALRAEARSGSLVKAAAHHGLQAVSSEFFTRADSLPGLGKAPEFMEAIFNAKPNSAEMARAPQGYAVFEVTAVQPPRAPALDEVRARVENDYKSERAGALLAQKTQQLADRARATHNLKQAAKEVGAKVKSSEPVSATSQVPDLGPMSGAAGVAFNLKPGEISDAITAGRSGAVLMLTERREPAMADFEKSKEQVRETLLQRKRTEFMEMFAANLRQRMEKEGKIRFNQEERNRLFKASS